MLLYTLSHAIASLGPKGDFKRICESLKVRDRSLPAAHHSPCKGVALPMPHMHPGPRAAPIPLNWRLSRAFFATGCFRHFSPPLRTHADVIQPRVLFPESSRSRLTFTAGCREEALDREHHTLIAASPAMTRARSASAASANAAPAARCIQ